jgi:hypothetical protein
LFELFVEGAVGDVRDVVKFRKGVPGTGGGETDGWLCHDVSLAPAGFFAGMEIITNRNVVRMSVR